ncbi:hypothetical protein JW926_18720 [Candidatus Sumerlaeota bacterium]|nr:hypothetical protein [Candidatus Sumerlaeota bacterium]
MIETIIESKFTELSGDPDEGLPVRKSLYNRLLRQKKAVSSGERGEHFDDAVKQVGLR